MVVSLFNIARVTDFKNVFINKFSGLSLTIYLIHENLIFRTYYRPYMIHYILEHFGYRNVLFWMLFLALIIFLFSAFISVIYAILLHKSVNKISNYIYSSKWQLVWGVFESFVLKI